MRPTDVIVAGAGASGLAAAIEAARRGADVTVLEGARKPGQKLLRTGAGRCNLANEAPPHGHYFGKHPEFAEKVFQALPSESLEKWFSEAGILTVSFGGLKYPASEQASQVLKSLLNECGRLGVRIKLSETVREITLAGDHLNVKTDGWNYPAKAVILSCGSPAGLKANVPLGYEVCEKLGLGMIPPRPALVPLIVSADSSSGWAGVRQHAAVTLFSDGKAVGHEKGQIQFIKGGISGIAVFNLSSLAEAELGKNKCVQAELDLAPLCSEKELDNFFSYKMRYASGSELLETVIPEKLIPAVCAFADHFKDKMAGKAGMYTHAVKHFLLDIRGTGSFAEAQACLGGVDTDEIDPASMAVKRKNGVYVTGELLDIAGACGGFNLEFAFSTGILAGRCAAVSRHESPHNVYTARLLV